MEIGHQVGRLGPAGRVAVRGLEAEPQVGGIGPRQPGSSPPPARRRQHEGLVHRGGPQLGSADQGGGGRQPPLPPTVRPRRACRRWASPVGSLERSPRARRATRLLGQTQHHLARGCCAAPGRSRHRSSRPAPRRTSPPTRRCRWVRRRHPPGTSWTATGRVGASASAPRTSTASSVTTLWYSLQKSLKMEASGPGCPPARYRVSVRIPR